MPRESAEDKGRRLLTEGRLTILHLDGVRVVARCRGDSGEEYELGHDPAHPSGYFCSCAARGRCSHLVALQLVTIRNRRSD